MARDQAGQLVVLDASDVPQRYPRALGRKPVATVGQTREEMERVYRAVAAGKISTKQGAQMIYMLQVIAKTIEVEKIEPMLEMIRQWKASQQLGA
jgi:hypothetical protein